MGDEAQDVDAVQQSNSYLYIHQAGSAALIWASREGHFDVAKALLAAGADTEAKDKVGGVVGA